jgi:predicted DNA-binding transcriptional regulator YafY
MYALDRMLSVEVLPDTFKMPEEINAREWFKTIYGVRKYDDMKPQKVLIKAYGKQARYFRSLPLHSSQEEVETHKDYSVFSYELAPDYDFVQDVLGFGDMVEILEPLGLRNRIGTIVANQNRRYNG